MIQEEILTEQKIRFLPSQSSTEKGDGKSGFFWTYHIKDSAQWFSVNLIEENGDDFVEACSEMEEKKYVSVNIKDFIQFIKSELLNN